MQPSESSIQAEIVRWYNNSYCLKTHSPRNMIFSVPNGGTRHRREAMVLKATGLLPGVSDLVIIHNGRVVFVEVKTPDGRISKEQVDFKERVEVLGFMYWITYSIEQFKRLAESNFFTD